MLVDFNLNDNLCDKWLNVKSFRFFSAFVRISFDCKYLNSVVNSNVSRSFVCVRACV